MQFGDHQNARELLFLATPPLALAPGCHSGKRKSLQWVAFLEMPSARTPHRGWSIEPVLPKLELDTTANFSHQWCEFSFFASAVRAQQATAEAIQNLFLVADMFSCAMDCAITSVRGLSFPFPSRSRHRVN
jgi:hypothetical protein